VHGVRTGVVVVDYDTDGCVCAEVDDVPIWVIGVGVILLLSKEEDGIIVIALKGIAVHVEVFLASCVNKLVDGYVVGHAWFRERNRIVGDCFVEWVLSSVSKLYKII
jgi:hypothetical protein